ncbi:endoplasmic reticulum membrane sensor NFE2L1-like [Penaeus indicus]|uniref:endoplasmic reticulum membrane sensor NFE2L1-like n=1 Tax=Penaeus indicus TaxID=29960 RepID=UPI00300D5FF6
MLLYARKKLIRDERVLQLVLLLSLLRGDPDSLLFGPGGSAPLADLPHDLILGPSLGHARSSSPLLAGGDLHPKSMDRMLADYQRSVLDDLNALGRYTAPSHHSHVHAYLLNTHTSLPSPPTADTPDHHHQGPDSPPTQPTNILPDPPPPESNLSEDDDLTPEDLALIEALWKQDVDLGVPREVFEEDGLEPPVDSQTKDKDHGKNPKSETKIDEKPDENPWMQFNFTIDSETGKFFLISFFLFSFPYTC